MEGTGPGQAVSVPRDYAGIGPAKRKVAEFVACEDEVCYFVQLISVQGGGELAIVGHR